MKITRRQLKKLISEAMHDFKYPTHDSDGNRRPEDMSAFSQEAQSLAIQSFNNHSEDIDEIIPPNSGLNDIHGLSDRPLFVELYLDAFNDARDTGRPANEIALEFINSDEYGMAASPSRAEYNAFESIINLAVDDALK